MFTYSLGGPQAMPEGSVFIPEEVESQCVNGTNYKMKGSIAKFNATVQ